MGSTLALPLIRLSTGHLAVDVALDDGATHRFLLDTGAGVVTVSPPLAGAFGIAAGSGRVVEAETANGAVPVQLVTLDGVSVGGIDLTGVRAAVLDLGPIVAGLAAAAPTASREFAAIEGVLGRGFFDRADVHFDLRGQQLELWRPGAAPTESAGCVPFRVRHGVVEVRAHVGGARARTVLDLGANGGTVSASLGDRGHETGERAHSMGAEGEPVEQRVVRFDEVALGDVVLGPLDLLVCADGPSQVGCPVGRRAIFGVDALGERSLTLSYDRRELCLGPP